MIWMLKLAFCLAAIALVFAQISLEQYNIDSTSVTVSGISSGGAFATQYHVIYSTEIAGSALFAGVVYHCANGLVATALNCMDKPENTDLDSLIDKTDSLSDKGDIDATGGMAGDKVYIFAGTEDTVVLPANGDLLQEFYTHYSADIQTKMDMAAEHCQPTDFYGPECTYLGGEYINDCAYDGAFEALNFLYDDALVSPDASVTASGLFSEFDQKEFYPLGLPSSYSADSTGYIYVPSGCVDKTSTCRLHFAFHGCHQGREYLDDTFATETGYLETAEANNIIVVFPQMVHTILTNPNGCWDWWGYTGYANYATKDGAQIKATHEMITRLIYG